MTTAWTADDVRKIICNPYYCLRNWTPGTDVHEPMISEEQWINAAKAMIEMEGAETFLRNLLANLKGGGAA
jgi:hypothetical protein